MNELEKMTHKLVEYHNKVADASNDDKTISDELATEISNYLSNDVPPILLNADKVEAYNCILAICKWFPVPFLCNILTALVLYMFSNRVNN